MPRLYAAILALFLLAPLPLRAEQVTPEQLQALARHTQRVQEIYSQGLAISAELDEAETLIDRYMNGEVPEAEMRREVAAVRLRTRAAIDDYARTVAALPPAPRIGDARRDRSLGAFAEIVGGLTANLEAQWQLVQRLADAAGVGDQAAYDLANADSMALAGALIDAENTAIEAALNGASPNHPQRGLYHASIGSNLAMRAALIVLEDSLRGGAPRIEAAKGDIERGLERAERGIETGRRDAEAMLARLRAASAKTESDRISKKFVEDLVVGYRRAFDDETRIVEAMRGFLDNVLAAHESSGGDAGAVLTAAAQRFQGEIVVLIDARLAEQAQRLRLVEEFSAALAAL